MIGRVLSHYRILRPLGAGGMGEVYLARDSRLGRDVAIKILPDRFSDHPDRLRRFEQEARAASALSHPSIITIHDIGVADGVQFIVTEFVEGETLRARIARAPLSVPEALDIATQTAGALGAAHRAGIIHRDIKPENIMLRHDGYVKVLDFGLAKLTEQNPQPPTDHSATMARMDTEPGLVMGTVRYLSPEQARGIAVNASSDVFSLGIVLYEMLCRRLPFEGETATDVILSIIQNEPPRPSTMSTAVSADLEAVVLRALSKDVRDRYESAIGFAADLKRVRQRLESNPSATATMAAPSRTPRRAYGIAAVLVLMIAAAAALLPLDGTAEAIDTLAVLPLAHSGSDEETEYVAEGIGETLINDLAQLPDLKVVSRSAVARYKDGTTPDLRTVARELDVRAILTGRVVQHGDRLRISVELVDSRDNTQIWGRQYERKRSELLDVQTEIGASILEGLRLKLSGDEKLLLAKRHTGNTEAYDRYIRGRYHVNRRSAVAIHKGRDFFQQAIEIDPSYALAYSGMSDSYALLAAQAAMSPREAYPAALAAAKKAVELGPDLAEAHASLAHALLHTGEHAAAEREFVRAIELRPNYAPAHQWRSELLGALGRREEAVASARRAVALDPLDLAANASLAAALMRTGDLDDAEAQLERTLEIDPDFFNAHALLGNVLLEKGDYDAAIREYQKTVDLTGGVRGIGGLGVAYARSGRPAEARKMAEAMAERAREHYASALELARVYAALQDREATLSWLTIARRNREGTARGLRNEDGFAFLHSDPRFQELVKE